MSDTEPENQHYSDPEIHMADDIVGMTLHSESEGVAKNLNKSGIDGGQSSLQIEDDSNFSALDIHDQWAHMEKLIPANWIPPKDSETDQENRDGADDIPFSLEDEDPFDDDLEEDNFWDFGKFDWEQHQEYRNDGRLPALEQVHVGYFSEFSEISTSFTVKSMLIQQHLQKISFQSMTLPFATLSHISFSHILWMEISENFLTHSPWQLLYHLSTKSVPVLHSSLALSPKSTTAVSILVSVTPDHMNLAKHVHSVTNHVITAIKRHKKHLFTSQLFPDSRPLP
ncbi:hypothetical protein F5876DRAFT_83508 [Lentinula aff. lateritia]|uniref:Uncharacterized protein n=1 Tax=Lentinula aff. lateritia TaxID=2804960 RepID=A0ACC1TI32_9AGAR|nr:hypothetical protein F5876DRAFT_83508 [Lentinula aff. lateritia]